MTNLSDAEILAEIEKRIADWFGPASNGGWSEEGSGLWEVKVWIEDMRQEGLDAVANYWEQNAALREMMAAADRARLARD